MRLHVILLLVAVSTCLEWYEEGNPVFLNDESFNKAMEQPRTYKFIKLFTPWCRYCRVLKQTIEQMKPQYEHRKDIRFYELNCHVSQNTCFGMQAFSFPFTVIYGPDGKLKDKIIGALPLPIMKEFLDRNTQEQFKEEEKKEEEKKEEEKKDEQKHEPQKAAVQQPATEIPTQKDNAAETHQPKKQQPQVPNKPEAKTEENNKPSPNTGAEKNNEQSSQPVQQKSQPDKPHQTQQNKQPDKQPDNPQPTHKQPPQHPEEKTTIHQAQQVVQPIVQPRIKSQPQQSLQNNQPSSYGASKTEALIYIGFGVVLGYFLHDMINKEHQRPQLPI